MGIKKNTQTVTAKRISVKLADVVIPIVLGLALFAFLILYERTPASIAPRTATLTSDGVMVEKPFYSVLAQSSLRVKRVAKQTSQSKNYTVTVPKAQAVGVTGTVHLDSIRSYARIVGFTASGAEYLLYEIGYPFDVPVPGDVAFSSLCNETCILEDPVSFSSIRIIVSGAELHLAQIEYLPQDGAFQASILAQGIAQARKQLREQQARSRVDALNTENTRRNLQWKADVTTVSLLTYSEQRTKLGSDSTLIDVPYLYGFEHYRSGFYEVPEDEERPQSPPPPEELRSWSCSETDSGRDFYTYGETTVTENGSPLTYYDQCLWDDLSVKYINEYTCREGWLDEDQYVCPCGCENGACLSLSNCPVGVDWRQVHGENWLSPVENQGGCGSCWAFAAVGSVEAKINLQANRHLDVDLSEQQVISCADGDCDGGHTEDALQYFVDHGVVDADCVPYNANNGTCYECANGATRRWRISRFDAYESGSAANLKAAVIAQPVAVRYRTYSHVMVLAGYREVVGSKTAWLFQNSWGDGWGNDGYAWIIISNDDSDNDLSDIFVPHVVLASQWGMPQTRCVDEDGDLQCNRGKGTDLVCPNWCNGTSDADDARAKNGSFEIDNGTNYYPSWNGDNATANDRIPDGWGMNPAWPITIDDSESHWSERSVKVVRSTNNGSHASAYADLAVQPGKTYEVSGWVKARCTDAYCFGTILSECADANHQSVWANCGYLVAPENIQRIRSWWTWTNVRYQVRSDNATVAFLRVLCYNTPFGNGIPEGTGTVWCDGVTVNEVESELNYIESYGGTVVEENGITDQVALYLNARPTANVTVTITDQNNEVSTVPLTVTFTTSNWATRQYITVSALDDMEVDPLDGDILAFSLSSTDPNYNGQSSWISVAVIDNDTSEPPPCPPNCGGGGGSSPAVFKMNQQQQAEWDEYCRTHWNDPLCQQ